MAAFDPKPDKYKNVIFEGSTFPDDAYRLVPVHLNETIQKEYLPVLEGLDFSKGLKLLMTAQCHAEGFHAGTRSHKYNNPGNLGNTDTGANKGFKTLAEGIQAQGNFLKKIAAGENKNYPLGKPVFLKPDFSQEIQNNLKNYGAISGYIPGYKFIYNGELSAFIKIYATLPRISNSYLNTITSYFHQNQIEITPSTTLAEIIDPSLGEIIGGI